MEYKKLLEPYKIGNMELKNRVVMGPMATQFADKEHHPTDTLIEHYAARAKGGVGMIISEHTVTQVVGNYGHHTLWAFPESCVPYWKKMIDEVHKYGTKFIVQLGNTGNSCSSEFNGGIPTLSASAVPEPLYQCVPEQITVEQIEQFKREYVDCAKNMYHAGADGVMLHLANGYFFASFISGRTNRRTDKYGGTLEGRLRLPLEVIRMIREEIGSHFPIFARMAAYEENGGRTIEETKVIARALQDAGVQALSINSGSYFEFDYEIPSYYQGQGYNMSAIEEVRRSVHIPVMGGGRVTEPRMAEQLLDENRVDLVEISRGTLCDPRWVAKVEAGEVDLIRRCIGCTRCTYDEQWGGRVTCSVNPFLGMDKEFEITPAEIKKKVLVIGGGPAGLQAAVVAAKRGHKVILAEKDHVLGGLARVAAIPPKKHEIGGLISSLTAEAEKAGVTILLDTKADLDLVKKTGADEVIVATGSNAVIPPIPGADADNITTAVDLLAGKVWPKEKVAIIGGSMVGLETAEYLAVYGKKITVFEMVDSIGDELYWGIKPNLMGMLERAGVKLYAGTKVQSIDNGVITYEKNGEVCQSEKFDNIFMAVGMKSETTLADELESNGIKPVVIGDASKPAQFKEVLIAAVKATIDM